MDNQPRVITGEEGGPNIPKVQLSFITTWDQAILFEQLYTESCAGRKYLTGEAVKEILIKSELDTDTLAQIWKLSSITKNNYLTFPEFALAMHLTSLKIKNQDLPNKLSDNIRNEVMDVIKQIKAIEQELQLQQLNLMLFIQRMMPRQCETGIVNAKIPWAITSEEKIQYREIFRKLDSQGFGYLTGEKAREILSRSELPQKDLKKIWDLSSHNNNGKLNQDEFAVAMHLIYRKLNGYDIPIILPPELVPPFSRELSERLNIINSEVHNQSIGLDTQTSGVNYTKSKSFIHTPEERIRAKAEHLINERLNAIGVKNKLFKTHLQYRTAYHVKKLKQLKRKNVSVQEMKNFQLLVHHLQILLTIIHF